MDALIKGHLIHETLHDKSDDAQTERVSLCIQSKFRKSLVTIIHSRQHHPFLIANFVLQHQQKEC